MSFLCKLKISVCYFEITSYLCFNKTTKLMQNKITTLSGLSATLIENGISFTFKRGCIVIIDENKVNIKSATPKENGVCFWGNNGAEIEASDFHITKQ